MNSKTFESSELLSDSVFSFEDEIIANFIFGKEIAQMHGLNTGNIK